MEPAPDALFAVDGNEPAALFRTKCETPEAFGDARVERLEFSCRGERVPCTAIFPPRTAPLLLVQPTPGDAQPLAALAVTAKWVRAGYAVASIELPLHGSRRSPKWNEALTGGAHAAAQGQPLDQPTEILLREFTRQTVLELRRTLDLLLSEPAIDPARVGFAGWGVAAAAGAIACGLDSRVAASVLVQARGGLEPAAIDPGRYVSRIAPRHLLLLNIRGGGESAGAAPISKAAAKALHAAAPGASTEWCSNEAASWDAAWRFLSAQLPV